MAAIHNAQRLAIQRQQQSQKLKCNHSNPSRPAIATADTNTTQIFFRPLPSNSIPFCIKERLILGILSSDFFQGLHVDDALFRPQSDLAYTLLSATNPNPNPNLRSHMGT
jgi:hypothetical protein